MLQPKDFAFLEKLNNGKSVIALKDKVVEQLLYYEKKYQTNTFDIIYQAYLENQDIAKWKELGLEFIRQNGCIDLINKVVPIKKYGMTTQNKADSKRMLDEYLAYFSKNSIVVVSSKNPLYKKYIKILNAKQKIVLLYTNNTEDFDLEFSNVIVTYDVKPNQAVFDNSDVVLVSYENKEYIISDKYKNKVIYVKEE